MKTITIFVTLLLVWGQSIASNVGDLFKISNSGTFTSLATWLSSSDGGITWAPATLVPTNASAGILVKSGYSLEINSNVNVDQMVIESGATVMLDPSVIITVTDGAGVDLDVYGNLILSNGANAGSQTAIVFSNTGSATLILRDGSLFQSNGQFTVLPTASNTAWESNATLELTGAMNSLPGFSSNEIYGNIIWNPTNQTANVNLAGTLLNAAGYFKVTNTGTNKKLIFTGNSIISVSIGGDLIIEGGNVEFSNSSSGNNLIIGGNYTQTAGSFTAGNNNSLAINFSGVDKTYTQSGGIITTTDIDFIVESGASLILKNDIVLSSGKTLTIDGSLDSKTSQITGSNTGTVSINGMLITANLGGLNGTLNSAITNASTGVLGSNSIIEYNNATLSIQNVTARADYANLTISGEGEKVLDGPSVVNSILNLVQGYLTTTNTNLLTLVPSATAIGGSNLSYINGPLAKQYTTSGLAAEFSYPLGKSGIYRPITIQPTTVAGTSTFRCEYSTLPTLLPSTILGISLSGITKEYWDVSRILSTANARVKIFYQNPGSGNWIGNDNLPTSDPCSSCNVAVVEKNSNTWWGFTENSGLFNSTNPEYRYYTDNGYIYSKELTSFDIPFAVGYAYNVILANDIVLSGKETSKGIELSWVNGSAPFAIERSIDGRSFTTVGNTSGYSFNDDSYGSYNVLYYRIHSGNAYSKIIEINVLSTKQVFVYPNPTQGLIHFQKQKNIIICDILGRKITELSNSNLDLSKYPTGIYFIKVDGKIEKVVKY